MKLTAGIIITLLGSGLWIVNFLDLIGDHVKNKRMPGFSLGYLLVPTSILYVGILLIQSARRSHAKPAPVSPGAPSAPSAPPASLTTATVATFEIKIPEGRLRSPGVFELAHRTAYTLVLTNPHPARVCDAKIMIDGQPVGTWRIAPGGHISLEHPAHDAGRFTYFQLGTPEALAAGLSAANPDLGRIRVKFTPETEVFAENVLASGSATLGGTGLGEHSTQVYGSASPIAHDNRAAVIREIRLVSRLAVRPLSSVV